MTDQEILEALGALEAGEDAQAEMLAQVHGVVELRLAGMTEELLDTAQLETFTQLQQAGDNDKVWQWLRAQLPNLDELHDSILADYIAERQARA